MKTFYEINEGIKDQDLTIYKVYCRDPEGTLKKLIEYIGANGNTGHSFSIVVDPDMTEKEGRRTFGWDGDGSDYIKKVEVVQEPAKESKIYEAVIPNLLKDKKFLAFVDAEFGVGTSQYIEKPEDLNDGYCILVAKYLHEQHPSAEFWTIGNPLTYHVALKIGDRYYDAVDTNGVERLDDLAWAKQFPGRSLNPTKGIKYEH